MTGKWNGEDLAARFVARCRHLLEWLRQPRRNLVTWVGVSADMEIEHLPDNKLNLSNKFFSVYKLILFYHVKSPINNSVKACWTALHYKRTDKRQTLPRTLAVCVILTDIPPINYCVTKNTQKFVHFCSYPVTRAAGSFVWKGDTKMLPQGVCQVLAPDYHGSSVFIET